MIENIGAYSQVDYDRGYQQGRAEAIEEVKNKVIAWNMQSDDGWIPCGQVIEWLEQLKELSDVRN